MAAHLRRLAKNSRTDNSNYNTIEGQQPLQATPTIALIQKHDFTSRNETYFWKVFALAKKFSIQFERESWKVSSLKKFLQINGPRKWMKPWFGGKCTLWGMRK